MYKRQSSYSSLKIHWTWVLRRSFLVFSYLTLLLKSPLPPNIVLLGTKNLQPSTNWPQILRLPYLRKIRETVPGGQLVRPNPYIFIPFLQAGWLFCHHYYITLSSSPQFSTFLSATSKKPSSLDCRLRTAAPLQRADIVLQPCLEQNLRWEALQDNLASWQSFRIQMQRRHLKVPLPSRQLFKNWASIYR